MDEFRVEVVNIAEEAQRLKEEAKTAAKSQDVEGGEEEGEVVPSLPCNIKARPNVHSPCSGIVRGANHCSGGPLDMKCARPNGVSVLSLAGNMGH